MGARRSLLALGLGRAAIVEELDKSNDWRTFPANSP